MTLKFHLVALSSDICEDSFDEGEGASTGCGYQNQPIGQTFDTLRDVVKYLASTFGLSSEIVDYDVENDCLTTSKTVANHSEAQNGGWFEATQAELSNWRKGLLKLYSENFTIRFVRCA